MAERSVYRQRWIHGAAYFGVFALILLVHLVPLSIVPGRIPGPDLLVALTFAWVLRRPQYAPTLLVAVMFLLADVYFMRPLGLWTALTVLGVEFLRAREHSARETPFPLEWLTVAAVLLVITLGNRIILGLFLVEQVNLGLDLVKFIATILAYPLVVLVSVYVFKVTKIQPTQTDAKGRPR